MTLIRDSAQLLLRSSRTELLGVGKVESVDGIVMESCIVSSGQETTWILLWSPRTELFKFVKLFSGDGVEITGNSLVTLAQGETAWSLLCHIMVMKYMSVCSLTKYLYYGTHPYDCSKNWS